MEVVATAGEPTLVAFQEEIHTSKQGELVTLCSID